MNGSHFFSEIEKIIHLNLLPLPPPTILLSRCLHSTSNLSTFVQNGSRKELMQHELGRAGYIAAGESKVRYYQVRTLAMGGVF